MTTKAVGGAPRICALRSQSPGPLSLTSPASRASSSSDQSFRLVFGLPPSPPLGAAAAAALLVFFLGGGGALRKSCGTAAPKSSSAPGEVLRVPVISPYLMRRALAVRFVPSASALPCQLDRGSFGLAPVPCFRTSSASCRSSSPSQSPFRRLSTLTPFATCQRDCTA